MPLAVVDCSVQNVLREVHEDRHGQGACQEEAEQELAWKVGEELKGLGGL